MFFFFRYFPFLHVSRFEMWNHFFSFSTYMNDRRDYIIYILVTSIFSRLRSVCFSTLIISWSTCFLLSWYTSSSDCALYTVHYTARTKWTGIFGFWVFYACQICHQPTKKIYKELKKMLMQELCQLDIKPFSYLISTSLDSGDELNDWMKWREIAIRTKWDNPLIPIGFVT